MYSRHVAVEGERPNGLLHSERREEILKSGACRAGGREQEDAREECWPDMLSEPARVDWISWVLY